jgi:hypothetical protein
VQLMQIETAWVRPPPQVGGLDHLAVQAPCINVYGRLLPGITNVTDRARYYSFYPWLIWALDQSGHTRFDDDFIERFRRADCLFSLIAERHAVTTGGEYQEHAAAMVGSNTLGSVARSIGQRGSVTLSDYSLREGAKARYFANRLGGLGQYYLGVLRELAVLDGDSSSGIRYTRQVGEVIARHLDAGVNRELFMAVVEADAVTAAQLDDLAALCPCQLEANGGEHEILTELFFVRGLFYNAESLPRRRSLQSILHLAGLLAERGGEINEATFRGCVYTGSLPDGKRWLVPDTLNGNRAKWSIYARNEILSIAVQGLFFSLLDAYEESGLRFATGTEIGDWFLTQPEVKEALAEIGGRQRLYSAVANAKSWLPALGQWHDPAHEIQLMEEVARLSHMPKNDENRRIILVNSLCALIALAGRRSPKGYQYGDFVFDKGYFEYYPINLQSFDSHWNDDWRSLTVKQWLRWLLTRWGIDVHLRVGLRKLRGQSQSTFRVRPSDRGMEVIEVPPAAHTRPRFNQSLRILKDIRALERTASGSWRPSGLGNSMLELGDAP